MPPSDLDDLPAHFRNSLAECQQLYVSSGQLIASDYPELLPGTPEQFIQLMDDLHRALLVKIFVTICEADRRWSTNEKKLGETLLYHLWNQRLQGDQLKAALRKLSEKATTLKWYSLVRPFDQIAPLRDHVGELETLVIRIANLVARADGHMNQSEASTVKTIQNELHLHLRSIPIDAPDQHEQAEEARIKTIKKIFRDADKLPHAQASSTATQADAPKSQVK